MCRVCICAPTFWNTSNKSLFLAHPILGPYVTTAHPLLDRIRFSALRNFTVLEWNTSKMSLGSIDESQDLRNQFLMIILFSNHQVPRFFFPRKSCINSQLFLKLSGPPHTKQVSIMLKVIHFTPPHTQGNPTFSSPPNAPGQVNTSGCWKPIENRWTQTTSTSQIFQ